MTDMFKAHIFKERSVGMREEVRLKLFNLDGSPYEDDNDHPSGPLGPMIFNELDGDEILQIGTFDVQVSTSHFQKPGIKWPRGAILWESGDHLIEIEGTFGVNTPDDTNQNAYFSGNVKGDQNIRMGMWVKLDAQKYLGYVMGLRTTGVGSQSLTYWGLLEDFVIGQRNGGARYRIWDTFSGSATITRTKGGLELVGGNMSPSAKYGPGVKFMTSDAEVTTEVPKLGAGIFGRATETYDADTKGGMALDFFTAPNNPGINALPLIAFQINEDQSAKFQKGVGFFNKTPPAALPAAITSPTADVAALKTAVDAIRTALTGVGITA